MYFINNFINKKSWDEENTNYLEREKNFLFRLYFWTSYKKSKRAFKLKDKSFIINFGGGNNKIEGF